MNFIRTLSLAPVLLAVAAQAADHREAPIIQQDATADINDVYVFINPNNSDNVTMIMTVNPFIAPSENVTYNFSENVRYSFKIDQDFDNFPDVSVDFQFSAVVDGPQQYTLDITGLEQIAGTVTPPSEEPEAPDAIINEGPYGIRSYAGQADDPFFFDVVGFFRFLAGTGTFSGVDGFAGYNTSAIAIDLPKDLISGSINDVQVWGTTERRYLTVRRAQLGQVEEHLGPYMQMERMGNPAINTALIPLAKKDRFNIGTPDRDAADFAADIVASLQSLGTNAENINILAGVAVPDTLKISLEDASAYPNGRTLDDDVIDTLFFFIFNQQNVSDGVQQNDKSFRKEFPFLASPHQPK